jgi:hypothetical protein
MLFLLPEISVLYIGNVYVADIFGYTVRKITVSTGIITTLAGTGSSSYSGDGGAATSAGMAPRGIAVDSTGRRKRVL